MLTKPSSRLLEKMKLCALPGAHVVCTKRPKCYLKVHKDVAAGGDDSKGQRLQRELGHMTVMYSGVHHH